MRRIKKIPVRDRISFVHDLAIRLSIEANGKHSDKQLISLCKNIISDCESIINTLEIKAN